MLKHRVIVQGHGTRDGLLKALEQLARTVDFDRARGSFAYASAGGALLLESGLQVGVADWDRTDKRWLVAMDYGHTEPQALSLLASLRRSEVRVPDADRVLRQGLRPTRCFHPKLLLLDRKGAAKDEPGVLLVGSGNLTVSGLRLGHEAGAVFHWAPPYTGAEADELTRLYRAVGVLDRLWRRSATVDDALIERYARARHSRGATGPDDESTEVRTFERRAGQPMTDLAELAAAEHLWVEIHRAAPNRGDEPGSQTDLKRGTRVFFRVPMIEHTTQSALATITIRYRRRSFKRNLRIGPNGMDKLDLPIPGSGGPTTYDNSVILLRRTRNGSYEMTLGSPNEIANWRRRSIKRGTLYKLRGGREFGVF